MAKRKIRKKQKRGYDHDPSHNAAIGGVVITFLLVACWSWAIAKFVSEPFSTFLIVPAWIVAVVSIVIIVAKNDQRSTELVDKYDLRCPKCGNPTVKSGGRRGSNDPAYGVTKCFSCDTNLD